MNRLKKSAGPSVTGLTETGEAVQQGRVFTDAAARTKPGREAPMNARPSVA